MPTALRDETALHFAGAYPGSFGALLRGPQPTDEEQIELINVLDLRPTVLDRAVETVLGIVDLAGAEEVGDGPIVDAVLPLGSRAFKHLRDLSSAVVDEDLTDLLIFQSPSVTKHSGALTMQSATRLRDVLGRNTESEERVVHRGRLGTVSDIDNRIDLQTAEEVISAKVTDDLVPELRQFYTERVVATFTRRSATSTVTGLVRQSYVLVGLAADDSDTGST